MTPEKLAKWHEWGEIDDCDHTTAAATIRAAMEEIERVKPALPLIECIADWERENGTLAAIMPDEYRDFCERIAKAAIQGSARAVFSRAALNQKGPQDAG